MTAAVVILPTVRRDRRGDLSFVEQRDREIMGRWDERRGRVPPRTRPLLVIDNGRADRGGAPWRRRA